jgi:hypothetical protein
MNNKQIWFIFATILIAIGLLKPDLSQIINRPIKNDVVVTVEKPTNPEILDECEDVIKALKNGPSSRATDGKNLASLYVDMSTLVALDGEDLVVRNTEEIRQANRLAGLMLKLDLKGKYPDLRPAAEKLIIASIGDDQVLLDSKLRKGAVDGFKALAWACQEGSK